MRSVCSEWPLSAWTIGSATIVNDALQQKYPNPNDVHAGPVSPAQAPDDIRDEAPSVSQWLEDVASLCRCICARTIPLVQ